MIFPISEKNENDKTKLVLVHHRVLQVQMGAGSGDER